MKPETMTLIQFCERTGIHHTVAARGFTEGKLPGIKIGRYYHIRIEWVERWERGESGFWSQQPTYQLETDNPYIRRAV